MLVKISMVLYVIAAILNFINGQLTLLVLSVVLGIITTILSMYLSYRQVGLQLKKYRETVWQMEAEGASEDEILKFMEQDTEVDESKLLEAPLWINLLVILSIVASVVLFILGAMEWLNI